MFDRLTELREEITEVDSALCIAWSIIHNRKQNREVTPDEVVSELLPMREEEYRSLCRNHSTLVFYVSSPLPLDSANRTVTMH